MNTDTPILLVEDDLALRDLISLVLSHMLPCRVIQATNGAEALERYYETRPAVVVLDILLPHMNGLEMLKKLKDEGALEHTAVIVISALGYRDVIRQVVEAGARDFIVKPFDVEVLASRVKQALIEKMPVSVAQ